MKLAMPAPQLPGYLAAQAAAMFPRADAATAAEFAPFVAAALERLEFCFARIRNKYFSRNEEVGFDPAHSDQYAMFLYWVGNAVFRAAGDPRLGQTTYLLNKALHGLDLYHEVELPAIFYLQHPVGTVLGRARYADYFVAYQRCTVGGNLDLQYPVLGEGVALMAGAAVLGDCRVGANVWFSAGTLALDEPVEGNAVVFGQSPRLGRKSPRRNVRDFFFQEPRGA